MMSNKATSKKSGEFRYPTRLLSLEKGRRPHQSKELTPLKACKQLLKSDDWEGSKFSLMPKNAMKRTIDRRVTPSKDASKCPKKREKVVVISKKSSSVRVVNTGSKKCIKGVQRSVSVKRVSYSTSVILSSEEDDESDSEDEEDEENEDDFEKKSKIPKRKQDTVIKHTMSKIRTNYCKGKKVDNRSNKKAKALKLLREKSGKRKSHAASRELRPRFPYSPTQEWPTARAHRMASLNALAKVHVLYENEGRTQGEPEETFMNDLNDDNSPGESKFNPAKETKPNTREKERAASRGEPPEKKRKIEVKAKVVKKRQRRKVPCDVEIIDTRICRRMASLNAQAILAASYVQEKPRRREKKNVDRNPIVNPDSDVDTKEGIVEACDLQIAASRREAMAQSSVDSTSMPENSNQVEIQKDVINQPDESASASRSSAVIPACEVQLDDKSGIKEIPTMEGSLSIAMATSCKSSDAVGLTKYTKVTKVHVNTTNKEIGIKEERNAEKKTEEVVEQDGVAITEMFLYESSPTSESYSVRMEASFSSKQGSRTISPSVGHQRAAASLPQPHVMGAVMPTRQSYYNYQNRPGYYQPAGPMIQPVQDHYMIHKPVPYHPQLQQPIPHPGPSARIPFSPTHRDRFPAAQRYNRHSAAHAIKSKHAASTKHAEALRMMPSTSQAASSVRFPARPSNELAVPSTSGNRSYMPGIHFKPSVPKPCGNVLKQEDYKYPVGHDRCSYTMPNFQDCPGGYVNQPQHGIASHHSKLQPTMMGHAGSSSSQSLYLPLHPSTASVPSSSTRLSTQTKMELPGMFGNAFAGSEKFPVTKFEPISFKDNTPSNQNNVYDVEKNQSVWRPPLVVDLENDAEPKNTKTYIELDVPKACPRDKIVVVEVDKEEKEHVRKHAVVRQQSSMVRRSAQPDIIELPSPKRDVAAAHIKEPKKEPVSDQSKKSPAVAVVEAAKKKEPSALIRRAKLHGKQRTYRDSENRPLVPYSNKKNAATTTSAVASTSSNTDVQSNFQKPAYQPQVSIPHLSLPKNLEQRMSHGWSWEGKPSEKLVYITNDDPPFLRLCYPAMRHKEGDIIRVRDCVLLKSGARKTDLPFIAKITALWENPVDGEMTMSLFWYYRPEHTDPGRKPYHTEGEIFASKHCDTNSVACIEDKCYVLTFGEYCRYRRHSKMLESTCESPLSVVPPIDDYPRRERLPPSCISPDMVFYCRRVYDFRQKRILKNPM